MSWLTSLQQATARQTRARYRWLNGLLVVVLALVSLTAFPPRVTRAAIRTVPIGGSLQTAVNQSQPGDVIRLAGNIQANETVNLALMGSAVGSGPGNLTIVGVNGASLTVLGGNGSRIVYNSATPFPGTLAFDGVTFSTSASTTTPAVSLQNMGSVIFFNTLFDGIGAEGCNNGVNGCTGLYVSVSSGSPVIGIYSSTFRNIASDAINIDVQGTAQASIVVNTSLITDNGINSAVTNTGVQVFTSGSATASLTVAQVAFSNLQGRAVYANAAGSSILSTSVVSNVITNMTDNNLGVITLSTESAATSPTLNAIVADNQMTTVKATGVLGLLQSTGPSTAMNLQIVRNVIDNVDTTSNSRRGILVEALPTYTANGVRGSLNARIEDNQISNTGGSGIQLRVDDINLASSIRNNRLSSNNQIPDSFDGAIAAFVGSNNFDSDAFALNVAIIGNTVGSTGVYLESAFSASPIRVESTSAPVAYIQNNNTFNGGGTARSSGTINSIALNTVARPAENFPPGAFSDFFTVPNSSASSLPVLVDDRDYDFGDVISLRGFQAVSVRGSVITRDDNGTPANQADDRLTYTPLPTETGLDRFFYVVRDIGGRLSINQVVLNLVADSTPPDTTITSSPLNPSNDNTPTFQFTGTDNVTAPANLTFQCRVYLASATPPTFSSCTSPFTSATLPDGTYIFQVRAIDQVGNIDPTPAQYTWLIDTTGPTTTIDSGPANPTNSTSANFTFTGNDGLGTGVASFQCRIDGGAFSACTSPRSYSGLTEGSHTFDVRAIDTLGNVGPVASFIWVIDTIAPDTTITSNPTAVSNSSNATFNFTGNALGGTAIASFECNLDNAGFVPCTSPRSYSGLTDGSHTFEVRAIDAAGNVDATPATFTWIIDTTAPPAPVVNTPANGSVTNNPLPPVTGTAEPGSTVTIFIDGSSVGTTTADGSGNWSFTPSTPLSQGSHTVRARATDAAGNVSVDSNTNTFTVDTVEPDTTFDSTPPAVTNNTTANFQFSGNGTGSAIARFECSLDGATFTTCTSPQNISGLTEGSHTFRVRAVDAAGNTETTPASFTWIVDLTAPETTITSNPPALSNSANATFSFSGNDPFSNGVNTPPVSFECRLSTGTFTLCANPINLIGLPDGTYTFEVRAIDQAGNMDATPASYTWTIDTTAPPAPVVNTPANGSVTNNPLPPITGTAEPGSTVTVFIDGTSVGTTTADGSGNWSFTLSSALADGSHTVRARATDAANNTSVDSNTNTFVVDTVEPDTTFTTTPPAATNSTTANFTFTGNGTGSTIARFECSLDGATFTTCTSPQNISGLTEGSHTFRVRAVDAAGNTETTPASSTWKVDQTAPDTTITGNPPALSNSANATFDFTGNDPISNGVNSTPLVFECRIDGGAFATCTSPRTYTGLADGSHTFEVRAIDQAGNVDGSPASYTWTIDTTPPPAPVVNTPASGSATNNTQPPITGTAEPGSTVTVYLNGSSIGTTTADGSGSWSLTPSPLTDGTYTVKATATDAAGNTSVDSNTNTFVVDTVEPDTTFTATPPAATSSTAANFTFTGNGTGSAVARFECSLDGAAFTTCTSPQNISGLTEGNHTFAVRAVDQAGNVESTPASYTWNVDLTAPDTTITGNPPLLSNSANASFNFTGNDGSGSGVVSFDCRIDSGIFATCTSPQNYTGLADGPHTFEVRAVDAAGNRDPSAASYTWTIDTTPPPAPVVNTPANGSVTNNPLPPITGTAEPGSMVTVFIDGTPVGTTTADGSGNWSFTPSPLADGTHTVKATATDAAGNTSVDSNTNTFTVDTQAPDTTITANPPLATSSTNASFSFTGSDGSGSGVASFECSLDGGAFVACTSPQNYTGLTEGNHTFAVRAIDNANNVDASPATYAWTVDLTAPDTTITAGPLANSNSATATFSFTGSDGSGSGVASFECSLDGGAFVACTDPQTYTGLADGPHTFAVRAIDRAGNVDATPATYSWTIDTSPLTVTVEQAAGQADPTGAAPIQFTVTFNKPVADFDATDVDLSASTAPGTLSASVSGSGTTYTVTVSGMTGAGVVRASVSAKRATDISGNTNEASTSVDNSVTFSPTTPIVTGIVRGSFNPTNAATVVFTVTLSEDVSGLDAADFTLVPGSGLTGTSITSVSGSGTTYIVTVNTGSGSGTLGLNLVDNDTVIGTVSGIPLGGTGAGNGNFTGEVYTVDRIAPSGSLQPLVPVVKGSNFYTFTVVYTDNLAVKFSTIDSNDIRVTRPGGFSVLAQLVSATPGADGTPIQATYRFSPPSGSWRNQDNGPYTLTLVGGQITDTAGNSNVEKELGRLIVNVNAQVFLPIVNSRMPLPDLVVEQVRFTGNGIEVVVRNQGGTPVGDAFWVDLYIAPRSAPTGVNQIWPSLGDSGITWGVTAGALPIPPGGTLTLRVGDQFFRPDLSRYATTIAAGTQIYVQVDSANALTTYGGVLEGHERDGGAYNNIASASVSGGGVTLPPLGTANQPRADDSLPRRK
ncbi:MAG: hypothetical protein OHK0022_05180 [Roseiflexaceae bacterium]